MLAAAAGFHRGARPVRLAARRGEWGLGSELAHRCAVEDLELTSGSGAKRKYEIPTASGGAADHAWSLDRPWRRLIAKGKVVASDFHGTPGGRSRRLQEHLRQHVAQVAHRGPADDRDRAHDRPSSALRHWDDLLP